MGSLEAGFEEGRRRISGDHISPPGGRVDPAGNLWVTNNWQDIDSCMGVRSTRLFRPAAARGGGLLRNGQGTPTILSHRDASELAVLMERLPNGLQPRGIRVSLDPPDDGGSEASLWSSIAWRRRQIRTGERDIVGNPSVRSYSSSIADGGSEVGTLTEPRKLRLAPMRPVPRSRACLTAAALPSLQSAA